MRHVELEQCVNGEFIAISETPIRWGERMTLDLIGEEPPVRLNVRVVESRPVIDRGAVRHRVRLVIEKLKAKGLRRGRRRQSAEGGGAGR